MGHGNLIDLKYIESMVQNYAIIILTSILANIVRKYRIKKTVVAKN